MHKYTLPVLYILYHNDIPQKLTLFSQLFELYLFFKQFLQFRILLPKKCRPEFSVNLDFYLAGRQLSPDAHTTC